MKTVTIDVRPLTDTLGDFTQAWKSGKTTAPRISFESPELLFKMLSGKRWELLNAMTGAGPMSIREVARRLERDVKAVHGDVTALINAGLLSKTDDGMIVFPYDAIHVDFMLKAAGFAVNLISMPSVTYLAADQFRHIR
jgi:predicted transcriptional regulator